MKGQRAGCASRPTALAICSYPTGRVLRQRSDSGRNAFLTTVRGTSICIAALVSLLEMGCAINNVGLLMTKVTGADGAQIADVYSLGAHLRTHDTDGGLSVGLSQRSYVSRTEAGAETTPGWYLFVVPDLAPEAVSMHAQTIGLDL